LWIIPVAANGPVRDSVDPTTIGVPLGVPGADAEPDPEEAAGADDPAAEVWGAAELVAAEPDV
jgi:hypothetical protein